MVYSLEEKIKKIKEYCLNSKEKNPIILFHQIVSQDFVSIHGPEHHIIDGACFLTAFRNVGGKIDLEEGLRRISEEGKKMPGATCGLWGVCGSVTSVGAALAFIDGTGPLTTDSTWGNHMIFTSNALSNMSKIGGPRCCKRNAFISLNTAMDYVNTYYDVKMDNEKTICVYSHMNEQCIKEKCPYYKGDQL